MKTGRLSGICIPFLFCCVQAVAQEAPRPAPALTVRLVTVDIQVAGDGSSTQTSHFEIRATNDSGALQVGQTSIPYDASAQDIAVVEAHTLKPDGRTLPVDPTAIYDQVPPGQNAAMVTGLRSKLIVFPQFAAGDTAVYTLKVTTRVPNFSNQFVYTEAFDRTTAYDEVRETITAPKTLPLYVESHDVDASRREDGGNVIYGMHYSAPKPIAEAPITFSPLEHLPRYFVSSFKDYAQMGKAYAALTEAKRVVTPRIRALADEIAPGGGDPRDQARKLYEWVSSHVRYVAIELGTGSFTPHDVDTIVANGYGDCKDHDVLLQALLKAKGIDAESILINGDSGYSLTRVPTFTSLNHVITFVPQFSLYLDSSAGVAPFGILPLQEYGKPMVVASTTSAALGTMPVVPPGLAKVAFKTAVTLDKNGVLSGTSSTTATGPYAISLRVLGLGIQGVGPTAATRVLTVLGYESPSGSFVQNSPIGFAPEYTISSTFRALGWADNLSGKNGFYLPGGMRLFDRAGDNVMGPFNPGNMKPGEPTVCFSAEQTEDLSLQAPAGYQFQGLPNNVRVETPNLLFVATWSLVGDTMSVHRSFTSKMDQPLCTGAVRAQSAAALKQISASYDQTVSFTSRDGGDAANAGQPFYNSGYSQYNAGRYELAIADFDKAIALKPDEVDFYDARGAAYGRLGQYARAIENFDQAIKMKQDQPGLYMERADAHQRLGHFDLAVADFSKAIALKPDMGESYARRGAAYLSLKQQALAISDFGKAIALDPDATETCHTYYNRALAQGVSHPDLAIADLDKAIALKPDFADAYRLRGGMKAMQHKMPAAIADYDKALALAPEDLDALTERAYVHYEAGEYRQAIADYDKVLARKPDLASALFYRGGARNKIGQKEGERDIAQAIKLDPSLGK